MSSTLAPKLDFVLKALSMSRGRLASELGVDKSAVGRWVTGAVAPSAHNLAQFTALVATRAPGFSILDWDRDLGGLAEVLGVAPPGAIRAASESAGLSLPFFEDSRATTRIRGGAYEGFFHSTRPYAQQPGLLIHDHLLIRRESNDLLHFVMSSSGVTVDGWMLLLQNQLFGVGAERTSGACVFGILNGVNTLQAGMLEGLILYCALDPGRTPTATVVVFERIGDLTDDREADDAKFAELAGSEAVAAPGSVPEAIQNHLLRDFGPKQLAMGGDLLLQLPLIKSLSRGLIPTL
jgi:hypothetical protein